MRKFYIIIFLIFLPLSNVYSQDNTIVVDINYLLENSKKGKALKKEISKKRENNNNKLGEIEKGLKEKEKKLISQKNVLSESDFDKELRNFQEEVKKYNGQKKKKNDELRIYRNESLSKLISEINSIIVDYSKKNDIHIAMDKKYILLIKSDSDVTETILKILDK
tara:strand:- start:87 stop:581 length:495 start_codon:yes stop_codon:yes gene_type:complete